MPRTAIIHKRQRVRDQRELDAAAALDVVDQSQADAPSALAVAVADVQAKLPELLGAGMKAAMTKDVAAVVPVTVDMVGQIVRDELAAFLAKMQPKPAKRKPAKKAVKA